MKVPRQRRKPGRPAPPAPVGLGLPDPQLDRIAIITLLAIQFAFFWRAIVLRGFFVQSDIVYQFEPFKSFMHQALRAGRLPLWSPDIFCGYPVAAEGQIAAFYPVSLAISWLLPGPGAVNWLIVFHFMLAAVSMFLLARSLGHSPFAAWLTALVFSFGGYFFAHLHHVSLLSAAAWLPLVLLFVDRALRRSLLLNGALAGGAWAAAALCGHPQTLFYISLTVVFWLVWRWLQSRRTAAPISFPRIAAVFALVFALGLGLAAVQLMMTADLSARAPHGERGSLAYVTSFSLLPRHLLGLIAPNWQGTPAFNTYSGERYYWEYVLYLGLVPLALALIGAATRRGLLWTGLAVVSLLLALAAGNPLYAALRYLPGFADFRAPARFIYLFTFAASILVGIGWEALASIRPILRYRRPWLIAAALAVLVIADLLRFDKTLAPLADPEIYEATPGVVELIRRDQHWGRTFIITPIQIFADWSPPGGWAANPNGWIEARVYLPADVPQSFDLPIVGGYAGFVDPDQTRFFQQASTELQSGRLDLYSLVGTRHFAVPEGLTVDALPSREILPFRVFTNDSAFSRVFAVGRVAEVRTYDQALDATVALAHAGRLDEAAVVLGHLPEPLAADGQAEILEVTEPRPERITVRARASGPVLVVLNERWDPGWIARVDGRSVPLVETDAVLMGAPMPAGEHTVEFLYRPRSLITGRAITLASLALVAALIILGAIPRRAKPVIPTEAKPSGGTSSPSRPLLSS